jgi:amidase
VSAEGVPIGMIVTARHADEATLDRLAGQIEQQMPWSVWHSQVGVGETQG